MKTLSTRSVRLAALLILSTAAIGCQGPLFSAMYMLGYGDTQAEYKGLQGKRVVVVCRPMVELQYSNMNASKMISHEIVALLRKNVSKIDVVDSQKADEWLDSNNTEEFAEIGRAFEADFVLGINLLDFGVYQGQTLYRGKAGYELQVVDCKTGEIVFQKSPDQCVWPSNTGVPTSEKPESQFRQQFVGILAGEIARCFYRFDHREHFATDSMAFE
ncbi:MAG TPA: hypothetical protein VJL29_08505 [Thermoguttaceae bacterium]|nr:hypothetical protein [Thermoguttaceae bacterium]